MQRKHALATIAREQGHASWAALKAALEGAAPLDETAHARLEQKLIALGFAS